MQSQTERKVRTQWCEGNGIASGMISEHLNCRGAPGNAYMIGYGPEVGEDQMNVVQCS